jgi:ABC-type glycerol-3-phosphate transport system permease component
MRRRSIAHWSLFTVLCAIAALTLLPILFAINSAFKTPQSYSQDRFAPAIPPSVNSILEIWERANGFEGLRNSLIVATAGVVVLWVVGAMAAYALTKLRFRGKGLVLLLLLGSVLIPIQVVMYPIFNVLRGFGWLNEYHGLVLSFAAFGVPLTTFLFAAYFRGLPNEVMDAARIDGAGTFATLWRVVLPMSRPALATTGILNFVWMFNDLLIPLVVMQSPARQMYVPQLVLVRGQFVAEPTLEAAGAFLAIAPLLLVFLLAQRQLIRGATMGAVK